MFFLSLKLHLYVPNFDYTIFELIFGCVIVKMLKLAYRLSHLLML